jgi:hypothetical protein
MIKQRCRDAALAPTKKPGMSLDRSTSLHFVYTHSMIESPSPISIT